MGVTTVGTTVGKTIVLGGGIRVSGWAVRTSSGGGARVAGVGIGTTLTGTSTVISGLALTLALSALGVSRILGASSLGISRVGIPGLPVVVLVG